MSIFDRFIKKISNEVNISEKKTTAEKASISEEKIKKGIDFFNQRQYYESYAIFNDLKTIFPDDKKIDEWFIKSRNAQNERSFKISGKIRPKTGHKAKKSDRNKYIAPAIADKINTSSKKEVSFNNMSRGERIEKELEEMRENIRVNPPEDENESNEKDFPTNYSSNSFQVDENDIIDQPNLDRPLPHISPPNDKILEKFYQDKVNCMENPVHIENIKDRQSGNSIPNWRVSYEGSPQYAVGYARNSFPVDVKVESFFDKYCIYITYSNVFRSRPATEFKEYSEIIQYLTEQEKNDDIFYKLALLNYRKGDLRSVIKILDNIFQNNEKNYDAWILKGCALVRIEDDESFPDSPTYSRALTAFDTAINIRPSNAFGYFLKGNCYDSIFQYDEALKYYDKASSFNKNESEIYYKSGYCLLQLGKNYESNNKLFKALDYPIDSQTKSNTFFFIGQNYQGMGNVAEAIKYCRKALEINPRNQAAQLILSKLNR